MSDDQLLRTCPECNCAPDFFWKNTETGTELVLECDVCMEARRDYKGLEPVTMADYRMCIHAALAVKRWNDADND